MNLSIIIVNWNTRDLLARCLASVYAHLPQAEAEVLVVDNGSTDDSPTMVREFFPLARLIRNSQNVGFARANNQAMQECIGQSILLLNSDTEVKPGALDGLLQVMEQYPEAGAAGSRLLNPDGTLQCSCYPAPTLSREFWRMLHLDVLWPYGSYRMTDWNLDMPREVDSVSGACLLLRRTALDQVGLLDEDYFFYSEEVDLCYRLRRAGWRIYWTPQAQVVHYGGQSSRQLRDEMFLRLYWGKIAYFRKHHGRLSARLYKLVLAITSLPRLLLGPLAFLEGTPRRKEHLDLARLYRRLLVGLPTM
jgi:N-acetylglucosaminyl-diphospho-decaprenol L-rhamnosyltransferase